MLGTRGPGGEGRDVRRLSERALQAGLYDVLARVTNGYMERSPSGGLHILYRSAAAVQGNLKLAQRPATAGELADDPSKVRVLAETRGEGGYVVVAPTNGRVHPTGRPWELLTGGVNSIATISAEERGALLDLVRSFDEMPKAEWRPPSAVGAPTGDRPGDDFNSRTSWGEILEPHGWTRCFVASDGREHWRRPGKTIGTSATITEAGAGIFYVFSSSTEFEANQGYSKFAAYAVLSHGGDFKAAAKELAAQGYRGFDSRREGSTETRTVYSRPVRLNARGLTATRPAGLPDFPLEALPDVAADLVTEVAESLRIDPGFIAPAALVTMAAAVGGSHELMLKSGWVEAPVIWTGIIGRPGALKTPAQAHATEPLHRYQREQFDEFRQRLGTYEADLQTWEAAARATRGAKPQRPVPERVVVDDTTVEKLAEILHENPRGVAMIRDELTAWVRGLNQYKAGQGADRSHWLSFWSSRPVIVDRKANPIPVHIDRPVISVVGGIQPDMLNELQDRDARDDGFLDRLLFAYPPVAEARWTEASVGDAIRAGYEELIRKLLAQPLQERDGRLGASLVVLSKEGREAWIRCYDEHAAEMAEVPSRLYGPYAKGPTYAARIALVLHEAAKASGATAATEVEAESVLSAWAVLDYFKAHAAAVYGLLGERPEDRIVDAAVRWLQRQGGTATLRDVQRAGVASTKGRAEAEGLLELLQDRGLVTLTRESGKGGEQVTVSLLQPGEGEQ